MIIYHEALKEPLNLNSNFKGWYVTHYGIEKLCTVKNKIKEFNIKAMNIPIKGTCEYSIYIGNGTSGKHVTIYFKDNKISIDLNISQGKHRINFYLNGKSDLKYGTLEEIINILEKLITDER